MMTLAEIELILPEGRILNQSMGSVLQGALMERLSKEWGEKLHEQQVHPYSQYVMIQGQKPVWRIATLTEEAFEHIYLPLSTCEALDVYNVGCRIGLKNAHILREETYESLEEKHWMQDKKVHHIDLRFITSTSFKTQGTYATYPMPHLIFKGLMKKWNHFSKGSELTESHLADQLATQMEITNYHLHMHPYSVEGRRIKAFRGEWRIGYFKNQIASQMAAMLLDYANFCGSGIKVAMGMGGTEVRIDYYKGRSNLC